MITALNAKDKTLHNFAELSSKTANREDEKNLSLVVSNRKKSSSLTYNQFEVRYGDSTMCLIDYNLVENHEENLYKNYEVIIRGHLLPEEVFFTDEGEEHLDLYKRKAVTVGHFNKHDVEF